MNPATLTQIVSELSPEEQTEVREFITILKQRHGGQPAVSFRVALDELINAHPELLRRLAQ